MNVHVPRALASLDKGQQVEWMLILGANLTISARGFYATETEPGNIKKLMGHNEIQHRVFARIRQLRAGEEWTLESFVRMIAERSEAYDIKGDVAWAFKNSIPL